MGEGDGAQRALGDPFVAADQAPLVIEAEGQAQPGEGLADRTVEPVAVVVEIFEQAAGVLAHPGGGVLGAVGEGEVANVVSGTYIRA